MPVIEYSSKIHVFLTRDAGCPFNDLFISNSQLNIIHTLSSNGLPGSVSH